MVIHQLLAKEMANGRQYQIVEVSLRQIHNYILFNFSQLKPLPYLAVARHHKCQIREYPKSRTTIQGRRLLAISLLSNVTQDSPWKELQCYAAMAPTGLTQGHVVSTYQQLVAE